MNPGERLQAALVAALKGDAVLMVDLTQVTDAPPVRAARPYAVVEDPLLSDWGTKDMAGREGRIAVLLYDLGERPVRLRALASAAEDAVIACGRDLGGGRQLVTCDLIRSRMLRTVLSMCGRWAR
jgi:hypothetical protein